MKRPAALGVCAVSSVMMQPRLVWMFAVVPLPAGAAHVAAGVVVGLGARRLAAPATGGDGQHEGRDQDNGYSGHGRGA